VNSSIGAIIIIDTNIFISHLEQLKDICVKYYQNIMIVVPWIVLQELDHLKSNNYSTKSSDIKLSGDMARKAQRSISWLTSILQSNDKKYNFIFQNSIQDKEKLDIIDCLTNDDRILKCALKITLTSKRLIHLNKVKFNL
jgi:predicted ribonuclease YlaK